MTTPVRVARASAVAVPSRRPAEGDAPRRLRVVPDGALTPRARRRRARLWCAGIVALVAASLFGVVFFHVLLTQGQLQLDHIETRAAAEQARNERLRLEVAELQSPDRIVAAAQQQLGMVPPARVTYLSPSGARPAGAPATKLAAGGPVMAARSQSAPSKAATRPTTKSTNSSTPPHTVAVPSLGKPAAKSVAPVSAR